MPEIKRKEKPRSAAAPQEEKKSAANGTRKKRRTAIDDLEIQQAAMNTSPKHAVLPNHNAWTQRDQKQTIVTRQQAKHHTQQRQIAESPTVSDQESNGESPKTHSPSYRGYAVNCVFHTIQPRKPSSQTLITMAIAGTAIMAYFQSKLTPVAAAMTFLIVAITMKSASNNQTQQDADTAPPSPR